MNLCDLAIQLTGDKSDDEQSSDGKPFTRQDLQKGSFVLVKYDLKRSTAYYVREIVEEINEDDAVHVKFFKVLPLKGVQEETLFFQTKMIWMKSYLKMFFFYFLNQSVLEGQKGGQNSFLSVWL